MAYGPGELWGAYGLVAPRFFWPAFGVHSIHVAPRTERLRRMIWPAKTKAPRKPRRSPRSVPRRRRRRKTPRRSSSPQSVRAAPSPRTTRPGLREGLLNRDRRDDPTDARHPPSAFLVRAVPNSSDCPTSTSSSSTIWATFDIGVFGATYPTPNLSCVTLEGRPQWSSRAVPAP
jgi:hypothetical protein